MGPDEITCNSYIFKHPCSIQISGVSMAGKSTFVLQMLRNLKNIFDTPPEKIIISYSENMEQYQDVPENTEMVRGLDFNTENCEGVPKLIIIDDQMQESADSAKIQSLFTRGVHHRNTSVIYITQNVFGKGKHARDMRLNSHYLIIFKSPTFISQVMYLGRSMFPKNQNFLVNAYENATKEPYSYLFIDMHPQCADVLRVRSGILPHENKYIYIPQK